MTASVKSIDPPPYVVLEEVDHDDLVAKAIASLNVKLKTSPTLDSPASVKALVQLEFGRLDPHREHFMVLYLDSAQHLIECRVEFVGTQNQTSVYPREIARRALTLNAAAVILAHNHPSGSVDPSSADLKLTQTLKTALALLDVRVLDHIVAGNQTNAVLSMAEKGLM